MILILIDYSKYKAQEANFKFWDELIINVYLLRAWTLFH